MVTSKVERGFFQSNNTILYTKLTPSEISIAISEDSSVFFEKVIHFVIESERQEGRDVKVCFPQSRKKPSSH